MPRSPRRVITGDRDSTAGELFFEFGLNRAPATRKIAIALRQCPQAVQMIGKHDPSVDAKGGASSHSANRGAQLTDLGDQKIGAAVKQVHDEEEGSARNPIAAIIRHRASMPPPYERRNTLRCSALRLLQC